MKIDELIKNTNPESVTVHHNKNIKNITFDSRKVDKDSAFIAINGSTVDGHNFIEEAINKGANTLIVEKIPKGISIPNNINIISYKNTEETLGFLAANFYDHPSEKLTVIAITGTKGKTTVANMIKEALEAKGEKVGISGTLGIEYNDIHIKSPNTTPDSITLQETMSKLVKNNIKYFIMEASSQGFKRNRLNGTKVDIGAFLNIDQDHIGKNEHQTFEEYLECKLKIFNQSNKVIVNSGDKLWNYLNSFQKSQSITFSIKNQADYEAINIKPYRSGYKFGSTFQIKGNDSLFKINIPGEVNVENTLATLAILNQLGFDISEFPKITKNFQVQGRAELLKTPTEFNRIIFADFAHNRLSTQSFLENLRQYHPKRIISVFGIRWNETKLRRYDQGFSAGKFSDLTIYTEDYRGKESFEEISKDVIKGLEESKGNYLVIENRFEALKKAVDLSDEDDFIVLLGVDNTHIQIINEEEIYFNEEEIIYNYLKSIN